MGFWDHQLAEMESLGIIFDDEEVEWMEQGGEVFHLGVLPAWHPEEADQGYSTSDVNDDPVLFPQFIHAVSPFALHEIEGWRVDEGATVTQVPVCELVDEWWGRSEWSRYPSVIGRVDEAEADRISGRFYWMAEEYRPYRFWSCFAMPDEEVYKALQDAINTALMESHWFDLLFLGEEEVASDYAMDPATLWAYHHAPSLLEQKEHTEIEQELHFAGDPEHYEQVAAIYDDLIKAGIVRPYNADQFHPTHPPLIQPLEYYLTDERAYNWWVTTRAIYQSRMAVVQMHLSQSELRMFQYNERHIA